MTVQRELALAKANWIRLARAELKRRVAAGDVSAVEVLAGPPDYAAGMPLFELLRAQPRWGRSRSTKLLRSARISEQRRLGELTDRQRTELAETLEGRR